MFPQAGPQNTGSTRAEPEVYKQLAEQLSDEFVIIHSLPWLASVAREIDGRPVPTGEIDFLILHRELGILAVEVKGGVFSYDRTEFVYKRTGERIDPVRQVRRGTHALSSWLHKSGAGSWRIGYCILFPHCEIREAIPIALIDRTANPPQPIILDINALNNLGVRIQEVMTYWRQSLANWQIGERQFEKLIDIIVPTADYTPCWQTRINNDVITWLQLTPEQTDCLRRIGREHRFVVTGFPGTGKTLLLIEYARSLSESGQRVLILTYNFLLSKYLEGELRNFNVEVCTFHEQCRRAAEVTGNPIPTTLDLPDQGNSKEWYSSNGPRALQQALNDNKLINYDALLVDEGQVFHVKWWQTLSDWFSEKKIVVFCDPTQSFGFENSTSPQEIAEAIHANSPYTLTINLRSPRTVSERISEVRPPEYQLSCPRPYEIDTLSEFVVKDMKGTLELIINRLIHEEEVPTQSVVIIDTTPRTREEAYLGVRVVNAARFRGLESPVVVIWTGYGSDEVALFCAYTRATSRCIVIYDAIEVLKGSYKTFGQILLEADEAENIKREANLGLTSGIFDGQSFSLAKAAEKTINLFWCNDWRGWVIRPENSDQEATKLMWIYHLITTTDFPVYTWNLYDRGNLLCFEPVESLGTSSGRVCRLNFCINCEEMTPFKLTFRGEIDECIVCSSESGEAQFCNISNIRSLQAQLDNVLAAGTQAVISDSRLSIFLKAISRWNTVPENQKREFNEYVPASSGTIGYSVAHLLILTDILKMNEGKDLELDKRVEQYLKWCPDLEQRVDKKSWREIVARGVNTWLRKGILQKVGQGVYRKNLTPK